MRKTVVNPIGVVTALLWAGLVSAENLTPREILDRVDDLYRSQSAHGKVSMKVVTKHWSREMTFEFWSKGKDKTLIQIVSPLKEKGTTTLKSGVNIWNYLPKVKRVIKIPSSMMGGSWMGSHFTNDDLVKEDRMVDDYVFEVSFEGVREGENVIEISCMPKANAAVVWGKLIVQVRQESYQPRWIQYFDEDMELARSMTFSEIRKMGNRMVPTLARIVPTDKPNEYTEIRYDEITFDLELKDELFSLKNLQR